MSHKSALPLVLLALACVVVVTALLSVPVQAQSIQTHGVENNCINCHEDLYFLHDTGNWFCLRESPMECVDCHGGNPEAATQENAHFNRAAHPVINEDISKCEECHAEECNERVGLFDQRVGISQVRVAAPYTPAFSTAATADLPQEEPNSLIMFWEVVPLALVASLALVIYFVARTHHH